MDDRVPPGSHQPILEVGPDERDGTRSVVTVIQRGVLTAFTLDMTPRTILAYLRECMDRYGGEEITP